MALSRQASRPLGKYSNLYQFPSSVLIYWPISVVVNHHDTIILICMFLCCIIIGCFVCIFRLDLFRSQILSYPVAYWQVGQVHFLSIISIRGLVVPLCIFTICLTQIKGRYLNLLYGLWIISWWNRSNSRSVFVTEANTTVYHFNRWQTVHSGKEELLSNLRRMYIWKHSTTVEYHLVEVDLIYP